MSQNSDVLTDSQISFINCSVSLSTILNGDGAVLWSPPSLTKMNLTLLNSQFSSILSPTGSTKFLIQQSNAILVSIYNTSFDNTAGYGDGLFSITGTTISLTMNASSFVGHKAISEQAGLFSLTSTGKTTLTVINTAISLTQSN